MFWASSIFVGFITVVGAVIAGFVGVAARLLAELTATGTYDSMSGK